MNIFLIMHLITAVLVVLKLCGFIALPWLVVLSPTIIAVAVAIIVMALGYLMFRRVVKRIEAGRF